MPRNSSTKRGVPAEIQQEEKAHVVRCAVAPGSAEEAPVLIDFGISSLDSGARTTQIVGSPNYIAPEQALGHPTPRSDIYALGCIAIEMLTGRALHEHLQGRQPSIVAAELLATHVPSLAPNLRAALTSLVSLSQQERPAGAAALVPIFERLSRSQRTGRRWLVAWSAIVLGLTGYFALPRFFVATEAPSYFHVQATKSLPSGASEAVSLLGGTVRAGDRLRFAAQSPSPVRLHVFAAGASGVSLLFPAAGSTPSSSFRIPATENDAIEFDNTAETVRLWFCLSSDPWPELEPIAAAARQSGEVPPQLIPALEDIVRRTGLPALAFDSATQSFRAPANLPVCAQGSLNHERRK